MHAFKSDHSMLLVLPVPFSLDEQGQPLIELQASNGLRKWSEHFPELTVCAPTQPKQVEEKESSFVWVPADQAGLPDGVTLCPLPWGYGFKNHFKHVGEVKQLLAKAIAEHRYLQFAIGGCIEGDWAAVGAKLAMQQGRAYSVHTDWVTHLVARNGIQGWGPKEIFKRTQCARMRRCEYRVVKDADLGLFHGADCHDVYAPWSVNPKLIHDVHVGPDDIVPEADNLAKRQSVLTREEVRLVYAGRVNDMKGPLYWVQCMSMLKQAGVFFQAEWLGDGPMLETARQEVVKLGLADCVRFSGFVSDRNRVMTSLREADLLVFCHLTQESPRILIETLNQGTPMVGFASHYSQDLVSNGGGVLVPMGDTQALANQITTLVSDRRALSQLIAEAASVGRDMTDVAVFRHRSELIKKMPVTCSTC